jgi:hypothetical protein
LDFSLRLLGRGDVALMEAMLTMFGESLGEAETWKGGEVVGGIAAYELAKFEQSEARSTSTTSPWPRRTGARASPRRSSWS